MCHMLLLGTFIGWGRSFSLDRFIANVNGWRLEPFAPAWNLMLIRIIVIIPYFFGGIAKVLLPFVYLPHGSFISSLSRMDFL